MLFYIFETNVFFYRAKIKQARELAEFDSFSDDFANFDDDEWDEMNWDDSGDDSWGGDSWGEEENAESPYGLPGEYGIQMFVQPINNTAQQNKDNDMWDRM